ncbi:MAG: hypothetical protein JWP40_2434 [Blastococcus sp.]|nr:hypothetical protein [Blastococcus sp.]
MTNAPDLRAEGVAVNMYVPGGHAQTTAAPRQDVPVQLRRRRQASLRCEPLHDGLRDPWTSRRVRDSTPISPRTLHVEVGARTAWIYGRDGQEVFALLDAVGIQRRQWDAERKVWMIRVQDADDVMAFAEWRQRRIVTCEAVDR